MWRSKDQSGNAADVTRANAAAEGVGSLVELRTAAGVLRELGARDVSLRKLGPRYWYGSPVTASSAVSATRP